MHGCADLPWSTLVLNSNTVAANKPEVNSKIHIGYSSSDTVFVKCYDCLNKLSLC